MFVFWRPSFFVLQKEIQIRPCLWNGNQRPCYLFARKFLPEALDNLMLLFPNYISIWVEWQYQLLILWSIQEFHSTPVCLHSLCCKVPLDIALSTLPKMAFFECKGKWQSCESDFKPSWWVWRTLLPMLLPWGRWFVLNFFLHFGLFITFPYLYKNFVALFGWPL